MIIDIDFETRSRTDIHEAGSWVYAECASTDALILRYYINGISYKWWIGDPPPALLFRWIKKGAMVRAHNVFFEWCIWNLCLVDWPPLPIEQCIDTQAQAAAFSYQLALEDTAKQLRLEELKDTTEGKILIRFFSVPTRDGTFNQPEDFPLQFRQFDRYCDQDVKTQIAIADTLPDLTEQQQASWLFMAQMNIKGVPVDIPMAMGAVAMVSVYITAARAEGLEISKGRIKNVNSREQVMMWLRKRGFPLDDCQAITLEKYIADEDNPPNCRRIAELKKNCGKSSTSKYLKAINTADKDNRVHGTLVWHGARTGRPAGRLIQPQNLFRNRLPHWVDFNQLAEMIANEEHHDIEIIYEDLMNTLASATRSMISAPEGKELIATDFSQIEARIVFTLAREFEALKLMADPKEDIYCDMAGDIYHHEVNKMDDPDERFVGKQSILGLGYGMGHLKFFNTMRDQFDVFLELEFCKTVVKIYRKKYRKVQKLWGQLQKAAFEAVENPGRKVYACSNLVHFKMHKRWLYVYLPSGRRISYVEPKIKMVFKWGREIPQLTYMGFDSFTRKWRRLETHGAKLLENISQAIVADICDEAGQRVQKKGYDVLFFVHDEIIAEIDKGQGSIKEFERIVSKQISWLPKLPVAVDGGWIGKRYRKT